MNFLEDDKGNKSSMRLMCLCSLFAAMIFGYVTITGGCTDRQTGVQITLIFVLAAFAPKAVQKYIENLTHIPQSPNKPGE
jgi:hypothetical protein